MGAYCDILFIQGGQVVGDGIQDIYFDFLPDAGDTFVWTARTAFTPPTEPVVPRRFKVLYREFHADAGDREKRKVVLGVTAPSDASHSFGPWFHPETKEHHGQA